jgi:hypothetical protein
MFFPPILFSLAAANGPLIREASFISSLDRSISNTKHACHTNKRSSHMCLLLSLFSSLCLFLSVSQYLSLSISLSLWLSLSHVIPSALCLATSLLSIPCKITTELTRSHATSPFFFFSSLHSRSPSVFSPVPPLPSPPLPSCQPLRSFSPSSSLSLSPSSRHELKNKGHCPSQPLAHVPLLPGHTLSCPRALSLPDPPIHTDKVGTQLEDRVANHDHPVLFPLGKVLDGNVPHAALLPLALVERPHLRSALEQHVHHGLLFERHHHHRLQHRAFLVAVHSILSAGVLLAVLMVRAVFEFVLDGVDDRTHVATWFL